MRGSYIAGAVARGVSSVMNGKVTHYWVQGYCVARSMTDSQWQRQLCKPLREALYEKLLAAGAQKPSLKLVVFQYGRLFSNEITSEFPEKICCGLVEVGLPSVVCGAVGSIAPEPLVMPMTNIKRVTKPR